MTESIASCCGDTDEPDPSQPGCRLPPARIGRFHVSRNHAGIFRTIDSTEPLERPICLLSTSRFTLPTRQCHARDALDHKSRQAVGFGRFGAVAKRLRQRIANPPSWVRLPAAPLAASRFKLRRLRRSLWPCPESKTGQSYPKSYPRLYRAL